MTLITPPNLRFIWLSPLGKGGLSLCFLYPSSQVVLQTLTWPLSNPSNGDGDQQGVGREFNGDGGEVENLESAMATCK